jgi:predicted lipid-binding transport protein (Tim44 family)
MEQNSIDPMRQVLVDDIRNRAVPSQTQVMMMKAERIDLTEESDRSIASVRFRGMVSENENAAPDSIDEVWHFIRSRDADSRWMLAGIEQV